MTRGIKVMQIIDELNRRALPTHSDLMEKLCAALSPNAARLMLDLARDMTSSPLGSGDGNIIHAQRLLEERLSDPNSDVERLNF